MFFAMVNHKVDGKNYPRRVGAMTQSFETAKAKAVKRKGYITDESGNMVAQAFDESLPRFVGNMVNIGSGEDAYV
jgi:hypothetical protein